MKVIRRSPYGVKGTVYGGHPPRTGSCSGSGVSSKSVGNVFTIGLSSRMTFCPVTMLLTTTDLIFRSISGPESCYSRTGSPVNISFGFFIGVMLTTGITVGDYLSSG